MAAYCACCGAEITLKAERCAVCGTPRHGMIPTSKPVLSRSAEEVSPQRSKADESRE